LEESYARSLSRVHRPHTNLAKVPFSALSSPLLHTFQASTKQSSVQDFIVQILSEFAQVAVPFPQRLSAVGYCIISCFSPWDNTMVQVKSRSAGERVEIRMALVARCWRTQKRGDIGWGKGTHKKASRHVRDVWRLYQAS